MRLRADLLRYDPSGAFGEWRHPDDAYPPLSFERPELGNHVPEQDQVTDPIGGRLASSLAPAEWRLLAWLEREGHDYDVYSEHHLHTGALDLDAYQVVIISAHPEYWSRQMFSNLKSWVFERGGPWTQPGHQARVVLDVGERSAVGFQLGVVELVPRDREDDVVGHLGPDLLGPDWDEQEAVRRLDRDSFRDSDREKARRAALQAV